MVDKGKTVAKEPAEEPKTDKAPAEEPKVAEPKVTEPSGGTTAPVDDGAAPVGTDQHGRQLYSVKCADCGKQTQVPFKPSGDRPVYCRDCYMQKKEGGAGGGMRRGPRR